jgi:hypothetical protein
MISSNDAQTRLNSLLRGKTLHQFEGEVLRAALIAAQIKGQTSFGRAAKLLGLNGSQSIVVLLNKHPDIRAEFPARARI